MRSADRSTIPDLSFLGNGKQGIISYTHEGGRDRLIAIDAAK